MLGGLIGLGGAEFRLPLLVGLFGFAALQAVILNKALSLVVVLCVLPARLVAVPGPELAPHAPAVLALLSGNLVGAWAGAGWAARLRTAILHRVLPVLLVLVAAALLATHLGTVAPLDLPAPLRPVAGALTGLGIGVVAAVMGVAGGELLIPTFVLLYAVDARTAGSLSLLVSLPTMLVAFARYRHDRSFAVLRAERCFLALMAVGPVVGTLAGGLLVGVVPDAVLLPALAAILVLSAGKVWRHP